MLNRETAYLLVALTFVSAACASAEETHWKRLFPTGAPPARVIDVVDLQAESLDTKLAAITLQGLVNRGKEAKAYVRIQPESAASQFWLPELQRRGTIKGIRTLSLDAYFAKHGGVAAKAIVYDPAVPGTMNVAMMIGAVENGFVVSPDDIERFSAGREIVDLRGRWTRNADAYAWAFENLWPEMNHSLVATLHPTHSNHHLRDYLVAYRVFTFWITGRGTEDGSAADPEAEKALAENVLNALPPNIPIIGWWGADPDEGLTEYGGVGWSGRTGKLTLGVNWADNVSLYSGIPVDIPAAVTPYTNRPVPESPSLDDTKTYICFVIAESGDAPAYWPHVQKTVWADPARGSIPIAWSLGPTFWEMYPSVAEWFYAQGTPNDHFVMAPSGPGYCHPYRDFMADTPDPEAAWKGYLSLTQCYLDALGLRDICLYTNAWLPFERDKMDPVTLRFAEGLTGLDTLILGMGRDADITETSPHYLMGEHDVLVSHVFTRWDPTHIGRSSENNIWLTEEVRTHTPTTKPAFMFVHPLSWSYHPSDLVAILKDLGNDYIAVSPRDFKALYLQSTSTTKETGPR